MPVLLAVLVDVLVVVDVCEGVLVGVPVPVQATEPRGTRDTLTLYGTGPNRARQLRQRSGRMLHGSRALTRTRRAGHGTVR